MNCSCFDSITIEGQLKIQDREVALFSGTTGKVIVNQDITLNSMFYRSNFEEVVLGVNCKAIAANAFLDASKIKSFFVKSPVPPVVYENSLPSVKSTTFYVPVGCLDVYKTSAGWADVADRIVEYDFTEREENVDSDYVNYKITEASKVGVDTSEIVAAIESNEKVTAAALTDLDSRMKRAVTTFEREDTAIKASITKIQTTVTEAQAAITERATKAELTQVNMALRNEIRSNEKVIAAALNDLNNKISSLDESVIGALNTEV